jgi:hypothetical protein
MYFVVGCVSRTGFAEIAPRAAARPPKSEDPLPPYILYIAWVGTKQNETSKQPDSLTVHMLMDQFVGLGQAWLGLGVSTCWFS